MAPRAAGVGAGASYLAAQSVRGLRASAVLYLLTVVLAISALALLVVAQRRMRAAGKRPPSFSQVVSVIGAGVIVVLILGMKAAETFGGCTFVEGQSNCGPDVPSSESGPPRNTVDLQLGQPVPRPAHEPSGGFVSLSVLSVQYPVVPKDNAPKRGRDLAVVQVRGCAGALGSEEYWNDYLFMSTPGNDDAEGLSMAIHDPAEVPDMDVLRHRALQPMQCVTGFETFAVPKGRQPRAVVWSDEDNTDYEWTFRSSG